MTFSTTSTHKAGLIMLAILFLLFAFITACETEDPIETFSANITISSGSTSLDEDVGTVTITVSLSQENTTGSNITASYGIAGTATNGTDFSGLSGNISIANGSSSATATLTIIDDTDLEGDETIILSLDEASLPDGINLGNNTQLTLSITDNDAITISVEASTPEASEPAEDGAFTINLSADNSTGEEITINYNVSGTATSGEDFTALSGQAAIAAGTSSATLALEIIDDELVEGDETVVLRLTPNGLPDGFQLGTPEATITITDDDMEVFTAEVSMNSPDQEASEDGDEALIRIRLSETNSSGEAIEIAYNISGTATNGEDYNSLSGSVSIADGEISAPINIEPIDDDKVEGDETVTLTIDSESLPDGISLSDNNESTATISDNDEEVFTAEVSLTATDDSGSEDGDQATFQISLSEANSTGEVIEIDYAISGTATNGGDYTEISGSASIENGESTATINIVPVDDESVEADETVILTINNETLPEGLTVTDNSEATATIIDNDEMSFEANASLSVDNSQVTEGESVTFTIALDQSNNTGAALSLQYTVTGTATNGEDFASLSGSVEIANGESSVEIAVSFTDDSEVEDEETLTLTLDSEGQPDGISLADNSSATVNIADNDEAFSANVTVSSEDDSATEGSDDATFTITLDQENSTGESITVPYTISGTATNGTDYASLSGSTEIANGSSSVTVTLDVTDDTDDEDDETVIITLDTDNLPSSLIVGNTTTVTLTIVDNDDIFSANVTVSSEDDSATEGSDDATFTITLDQENSTGEAITVPYTVSGTATNGTDYANLSGSAEIANGSSSVNITVDVTDDTDDEDDETVIITLDTDNLPSSLTAGNTTTVTLTIVDNDDTFSANVTVSSEDDSATEGSDDATFTISLDQENSTGESITVPYTISGTATNGTDYASLSGSAEIANGSSSVTVTVDVTDDTDDEDDETVIITLDTDNLPSSLTAGNTTTVTLTIVDNDDIFSANVTVNSEDDSATEGSDDATFTITLDQENSTGEAITVPYTISGTATNGTDYASLSGSAEIANGSSSVTVTVDVTDDTDDEDDETVIITLDTDNLPSSLSAGNTTAVTLTIVDNDVVAFEAEASVSASTSTGQEGGTNLTFTFTLSASNTSGADITLPYTVSGTASSGSDFNALNGSAVIAQNATETSLTVTIIDDSEAELDETLIITLGTLPDGVNASNNTEATGTIEDNESINITFGTSTGNSIAISSWTNVSGATGYVVIMNNSNSFSDPSSGSFTPASTSYRGYNQQVIYDGTSTSSLDLSLLASGQSYYFKVYPYNGNRVYVTDYTEDSSQSTACTTTSTSENEVCWTISGDERNMTSNQYPDHETGNFPNANVTATSRDVTMDLTPEQASDITYVYNESGAPTPSNRTFYKFGVASNGLGFNPMGLKPFNVVDGDGNPTGEENWEWQSKVTDEGETDLDEFGAHVTSVGVYHYHGDTKALASGEDGSKHSLIYGFAADGFPIYYKYGYSSSSNYNSSIKELKSSYQLKSGSRGGDGLTAPDGDYDGTYIQDFEYVSGLGDLDECNGRFGVTPEFPEGTYYYVITGDFPKVPNCFRGTPSSDFLIGN